MESYILSTLFSVYEPYFNRSYSRTISVGKKIIELDHNVKEKYFKYIEA